MAKALHVTLRKKLSNLANVSLSKLFPVEQDPEQIDKDSVKTDPCCPYQLSYWKYSFYNAIAE